ARPLNLAHKTTEYLARPQLNVACDSTTDQQTHGFCPAYRSGYLAKERITAFLSCFHQIGIHITYNMCLGIIEVQGSKIRLEAVLCRSHQRAMEWRAHRE